ncbi:hypothetical protein G9A89_012475 [Geosiphon pyriformis]|nr:hypothetical protein G9A89_012475 [Geosiphon pyriformis]
MLPTLIIAFEHQVTGLLFNSTAEIITCNTVKSVAGNVVDLSTRPLSLEDIGGTGIKPVVFWGSKVDSVTSSVGKTSDVKNMVNTVAKETSYADDDNNNKIICSLHMVLRSNKLPPLESRAPEKQSFNLSKSFALNIKLSAVSNKTVGDKLICVKKIFYHVDGFGEAFTLSKFPGIIRSLFTSESSMNKTKKLAICEKIVVNNIFKKVSSYSDKEIVVKEIPVDLPKLAVESVFSKFGKIVSIKIQLIGLWQKALVEFESSEIADLVTARWSIFMGKNSVCVAKAIDDKQSWTLLYTLPVGTTAYNLSDLLESYSERTCFIDCNPSSYVHDRCVIVCFDNETSKLAAIGSVPVFKGMNLRWAGFSLACCAKYKQFDHVSNMCSVGKNSEVHEKWVVTDHNWVCLANIYKKKQVPIIRPTFFSGKTWAQVAGGSSFLLGSSPSLSAGLSPGAKSSLGAGFSFNSIDPYGVSDLFDHLVSVKRFLELLTDQVSDIIRNLSFVDLVPLLSASCKLSLTVSTSLAPESHSDMVLDSALEPSTFFLSTVVDGTSGFSSSSSKILTTKFSVDQIRSFVFWFWFSVIFFIPISGLVWKFTTCNVWGINVLAKQVDVTKLKSSSGLWIKDKYDGVQIFTFGLDVGYLGAGIAVVINNSLACYVSKVEVVPGRVISVQLLFKGKLSVTVLSLYAGASASVYLGQASEVNSIIAKAVNTNTFVVLGEDFNEYSSGKSVSFKFCSSLGLVNLFNSHYLVKAFTWCNSRNVERTIDYIFVSGSLSSTVVKYWVSFVSDFFDMDHNAVVMSVGLDVDSIGWSHFRDCSSLRILVIEDRFLVTAADHDLDAMWSLLEEALVDSVDELLIAKIVKKLEFDDAFGFDCLGHGSCWSKIGEYRKFKIYKSKLVQEASIRAAIEKHMEKFCLDKSNMIRSVLDRPFWKVVLNHLVVDNKLVLDSEGVRLNVDRIIESWTRKHVVPSALSDLWAHQYAPLDYVQDDVFSGVIKAISMSKLLLVVGGLPDGKATGLSDIPNKLWKHDSKRVTKCLLVLLNKCLFVGAVSVLWRKAWVLMIPKSYDWDRILTNICLIALIEMTRKILFKILLDKISFACSKFGVLHMFTVGSVVEDALEKNKELWLMCDKFIKFFGSIHEDRINKMMTDFGLSNGYRVHNSLDQGEIDTKFVAKLGRVESGGEMSSFFAAGAFVDNTIWIGDWQASIQYVLNIASEFFTINNISINSEKTVAILINQGVKITSLNINGWPIFIVKRGKTHRYLEIFLSMEGLSKPSLAKAHSDVCFFVNVILKKAITDKQFSYLVSTVLKGLKLKAGLPYDFLDAVLHYPSLYGLKFFEQIQAKSKLAAVVVFSNASGILGCLFNHRFLDLQVLDWAPLDPLQFLVKLWVSPVNNFLAGVVKIFLGNELSLINNLLCAFRGPGPVLCWFEIISRFLHDGGALSSGLARTDWLSGLDILSGFFVVYMDSSLKNYGSSSIVGGAAVYFLIIDCSIGVRIVTLALECVPFSSTVLVHLNSQAAIDVCISKLSLLVPDFRVPCWVERCHIFNLVRKKDLSINWIKVKNHSGVCGNVEANAAAGAAMCSWFSLPVGMWKRLLIAESSVMSGNAHHFVRDMFKSVCHVYWKTGPGCDVIQSSLIECVN